MGTTYIDPKGYERGRLEHSDLIHRQVAYWHIYRQNRHLYPLSFSSYQIHHKDGDKRNNNVSNLEILMREEHERVHGCGRNPLAGIVKGMLMLLFWPVLIPWLLFSWLLRRGRR